jgi:hypothetical protein
MVLFRLVSFAVLLAAFASASTLAASDPDGLARAADAKLDFARTYQGRWVCAGKAADAVRLHANVLLFTNKPGIHNFQLTFVPAQTKYPAISEVWTWRWMYGDVGSWYAAPDSRAADAGYAYTSDGPHDGTLLWKEHVAESSATRSFEAGGDGSLRFAVRARTLHGDDASYVLDCKRSKGR